MAQQKLPPFLLQYVESRVSQQLIQESILKLEGDHLGLQVSDADLARELHQGADRAGAVSGRQVHWGRAVYELRPEPAEYAGFRTLKT